MEEMEEKYKSMGKMSELKFVTFRDELVHTF